MKREELESLYIRLGNELEELYSSFSFKNHCYWRIANDYACKDKWDKLVKRPFYKNASDIQLIKSITILQDMVGNKEVLFNFNKQSLTYRKNVTIKC